MDGKILFLRNKGWQGQPFKEWVSKTFSNILRDGKGWQMSSKPLLSPKWNPDVHHYLAQSLVTTMSHDKMPWKRCVLCCVKLCIAVWNCLLLCRVHHIIIMWGYTPVSQLWAGSTSCLPKLKVCVGFSAAGIENGWGRVPNNMLHVLLYGSWVNVFT